MAEPQVRPVAAPATGGRNEAATRKAARPFDDKIYTWPHLVRSEFLCTIFILVLLAVWSLMVDAPLEEAANPTRTPNPVRRPLVLSSACRRCWSSTPGTPAWCCRASSG